MSEKTLPENERQNQVDEDNVEVTEIDSEDLEDVSGGGDKNCGCHEA